MRWAFPLGLSLSPDAIRAVRIARRGRRLRVADRRSVPLAQEALTVAPSGLTIADEGAVLGALKEALAPGRSEVALALPDVCCVAHVQRFPELKARGQELRGLLLWQAADLLPFPPKEARLASQVLHREGTAGQVAVLRALSPPEECRKVVPRTDRQRAREVIHLLRLLRLGG